MGKRYGLVVLVLAVTGCKPALTNEQITDMADKCYLAGYEPREVRRWAFNDRPTDVVCTSEVAYWASCRIKVEREKRDGGQ